MKALRFWMLAPSRALMGGLFLAPLSIIAAYSFLTRGTYGGQSTPWTAENYVRLLADPLYTLILARSFWIAGLSTMFCLLLGFPLALFIAQSGRRKNLFIHLVMLPFWTSFLVRTYAWMFLLRDTGLVNTLLQWAGVTGEPLPLLYNEAAVVLGLIYGYLPFMVLPIFSTLDRLDKGLLEAASDLGATPWTSLWLVTVPLAMPGIVGGCVLVFIPCLGAYLTPDLLGGGKSMMIGNLVQNQFTSARDWPFGSAISLALMALVMMALWTLQRRQKEDLL
ncbi:MAG: ABC transporter permease [Acidobacteriia bacterium]|nr:ABC transporter permease [Terriglobia bacterium]